MDFASELDAVVWPNHHDGQSRPQMPGITNNPGSWGAISFLPTRINELEMWQAETFDPKEIDKELGWAEAWA